MNDSDDTQNPFGWMPKPGQSKKIPGGTLWCDAWEMNRHGNSRVSGEIRFRFETDLDIYHRAMREPEAIECHDVPLIGDANARHLAAADGKPE